VRGIGGRERRPFRRGEECGVIVRRDRAGSIRVYEDADFLNDQSNDPVNDPVNDPSNDPVNDPANDPVNAARVLT